MGIAYTVPFKIWFSYVLFKYAHQLTATEEGKKERAETVKEAQAEMQQIGEVVEPVQAYEVNIQN